MLQNTLSALLQSVASRYAQLSPSDVGIGLRGGRLVVDDVQLRADTFNGPHVPFHVLKGRAGRLRVNVPWSALTAAPVEVYLENVHLIAGPKRSYPPPAARRPPPAPAPHWHQTNVGRLLFNVSVEMFGIKVEYRDHHCVAVLSVASLHAFSAGPDWHRRFVSLTSALHPDSPHATAVTMRKLLRLSGVHWVMIPRSADAHHPHSPTDRDHHHRQIDLHSFESHAPILDGIPITVKVLLCSGTASLQHTSTPGLHAEIHVDIDDPTINLTARQLTWIDHIVKAGFALSGAQQPRKPLNTTSTNAQSNPTTPKHTHSQPPQHPNTTDAHRTDSPQLRDSASVADDMSISSRLEKELAHQLRSSQPKNMHIPSHISDRSDHSDHENPDSTHAKGLTDDDESQRHARDDSNDEYDEEDDLIVVRESNSSLDIDDHPPRRGALSSLWQAIVSENVDDTVDDAAYALGLSHDRLPAEEDVDAQAGVEEADDAESQFAREAVNAAAAAGGLTMKLVVKTPDHEARDQLDKLRAELEEEKKLRARLQHAEQVLQHAEQRVQQAEALIQRLRDRNEALVAELCDLENMTSQAGKNKDAMIRQMEAALSKAERNLQGMLQTKFEQDANKAITKSVQVNTFESARDTHTHVAEENDVAEHLALTPDAEVELKEKAASEETQTQPEQDEAANQVDENSKETKQLNVDDSSAIEESGSGESDGLAESVEDEPLLNGSTREVGVAGEEEDEDGGGSDESTAASVTDVQVGTEGFSQMPAEMEVASVSISKLIADMSSKVEISSSSHNKRLEEAISSEGLTLI